MLKNNFILFSVYLFAFVPSFSQDNFNNKSSYYKIDKLIDNIDKMYVEEVDRALLSKNFIIGVSNQVTVFSEYHSFNIYRQNKIESIGIKFKFKADSILIKGIIPGSGAEKSGLKVGDKIFLIDSNTIDDMYYYTDVINHLCGKPNSNTHLKLIRGSDTLEKKVLRTPIPNYNYILISDKNFPNESLNDY